MLDFGGYDCKMKTKRSLLWLADLDISIGRLGYNFDLKCSLFVTSICEK